MNKMETRIRELESEVVLEARRRSDSQNVLRKSERRIQEMTYCSSEQKKNHERMEALVGQLQSQMKSYKMQLEEAEEIAALNLAKYRKVQQELEQAEMRANLSEQALAKAKVHQKLS